MKKKTLILFGIGVVALWAFGTGKKWLSGGCTDCTKSETYK